VSMRAGKKYFAYERGKVFWGEWGGGEGRGVHIGYILRIYVSMKVGSILERIFVF
jgi:hypothetical protein